MIALLLGCATIGVPFDAVGDEAPVEGLPGVDTPDDPHACSKIFDPDALSDFAVEIDEAEWADIEGEYAAYDGTKRYHPLTGFRWGDEEVSGASIRLKGNEGYSWGVPKMQFVVSFVEIDPDQRFHGTRHVAFDAPWYETTLLRNRLASQVLHDIGLPAPCANNGTLTVNGAFYGLYATMEQLDHEYLERNFGEEAADGNLYKYGWDLTNNRRADTSVAEAFWATTDPAELGQLGDVGQWVDEWAAEALLPDLDGYWCCGHNFYTYEHPTQGLLFLAWDLDATFDWGGTARADPFDYASAYVPHEAAVLADPVFRARFVSTLSTYAEAVDTDDFDANVLAWAAQIDEAARTDTRASYTYDEHATAVDGLHDFLAHRRHYLREWVADQGG